jgi:oligopeptide/dipeptide ABC transporter ATP-binding protein
LSTVLDIADLHVRFPTLHAVRGISLRVEAGQTHCLVGESGSGKSLSALAVIGLLPRGATREAGHILFDGAHLTSLGERAMAKLRGDRMAMIFQEPMTSLNPAYTIGSQMTEVLRRHRGLRQDAAVERSAAMLARVGISAASMRLGQFPHQLSGGLRQRVMIAMALLCEPKLLIADEPTTALDVTVQAQILRLLATLQREFGLAVLLITHDLGVVARIAQQVSVMYAGEIVEQAPVEALFAHPTHPYTRGLLASIPVPGKVRRGERLGSIRGTVPHIPPGFVGCAFRDRCDHATDMCAIGAPLREAGPGHAYRCRLDPLWRDAS